MIFKNDKINLLKSNSILSINGEYGGKKRFLIISIIAVLLLFLFQVQVDLLFFWKHYTNFSWRKDISSIVWADIKWGDIEKWKRWIKVPVEGLPNFYQNLNS
jgi:hypothetical protein